MESIKGTVVYTCKEGDTWTIFKGHLVIANPAHPAFMIDLFTGERKELTPDAPTQDMESWPSDN